MITRSDFIAIVQIHSVVPAMATGNSMTYSQAAEAIVEREIKGELPENVTLYGGEDFACAQVYFAPGRYLVFLSRDNNLLRATEWQSSISPISRDVVEWYCDDGSFKMKPASLSFVLTDIENILGYSIAPAYSNPKLGQAAQTGPFRTYVLLLAIAIFAFGLTINFLFRGVLFAGMALFTARQLSKILKH